MQTGRWGADGVGHAGGDGSHEPAMQPGRWAGSQQPDMQEGSRKQPAMQAHTTCIIQPGASDAGGKVDCRWHQPCHAFAVCGRGGSRHEPAMQAAKWTAADTQTCDCGGGQQPAVSYASGDREGQQGAMQAGLTAAQQRANCTLLAAV
jgi:hypothetical protein